MVEAEKTGTAIPSVAVASTDASPKHDGGGRCCKCCSFGNYRPAKGYSVGGIGRGALVMSNIFLASSLIFLASEEAGCLDEFGNQKEGCNNKVYGFQPSSFITNIAVISGVLSALFMPMLGAITDFTQYRRSVGIISAVLLILIQAVQIGTISRTWFPMSILQAVAGFVYQIQVLATYAYLPEIARYVGEDKMTKYTALFTMIQFGSQASFLVVVIAISTALGFGDVHTGQLSQAINTLWIFIAFSISWKWLPSVPASHELPDGHCLLSEGFVQTYKTAKKIHKRYSRGLRWYLIAVVFAEASANAFTTVSVVYLADQIGLSGTEIGIFFLIALVGTIPGAKAGAWVTHRLDPNRSWQISMLGLTLVAIVGALVVDATPEPVAYVWGLCIGILLGWFYATENLFFSMCLPKGQEAELSGFFVYCTQILGWAPPLIFTALIESNVRMTFGLMSITIFFVLAIGVLRFAAPWQAILVESHTLYDENGEELPSSDGQTDVDERQAQF